jgi:hypothetical protein
MFSAGSAAIDTDNSRPGAAVDKNAKIGTFIRYTAVKTRAACAAFLATGG